MRARCLITEAIEVDIFSVKPGSIQTVTLHTVLATKSRLTYGLESEVRISYLDIKIFHGKRFCCFFKNFL